VHGDVLEREPAGRAKPFEARELGLDRDAGGAGGVDQRQAVREHGGGGLQPRDDAELGARGARFAHLARRALGLRERGGEPRASLTAALDGRGPQLHRIRVDAQDDLRPARLDRVREARTKVGPRGSGAFCAGRPGGRSARPRAAVAGRPGHFGVLARPGAGAAPPAPSKSLFPPT
jgi:hypothetical protein